jgi:hypothetical protein
VRLLLQLPRLLQQLLLPMPVLAGAQAHKETTSPAP